MTDTVVDPSEDLSFVMASNYVFSIKLDPQNSHDSEEPIR